MSRHAVLVVRRFRGNGEGTTELVRAVELGISPVSGMLLTFADGSPDCTVSQVCHRVGTRPDQGVHPIEVELRCARESVDGLEAALAAGWQRVEAAL
jgi:hypothetical protein